jgi:hypothetical protein
MGSTYSVSGYTMELRGDDGSVQRLLALYPFPKDGRDRVYLGDVTFGPNK